MSFRLKLASVLCVLSYLFVGFNTVHARDFGKVGTTFPIIEQDLLSSIQSKLKHLEASGAIERSNKKMVAVAKKKALFPDPVGGVIPATEGRTWLFDPAIVVSNDIKDTKGNLIAPAGKKVSPLQFVSLTQKLVFISGADQQQVDWAFKNFSADDAKIIFVNGSPVQQMRKRKRRLYFDQGGYLSAKFGVTHTPTVGSQEGLFIRFNQLPLGQKKRAG